MSRNRPLPVLQPPLPAGRTRLGKYANWVAAAGAIWFLVWLLPSSGDPVALVGGMLILTFLAGAPTGRDGTIAPLDLLLSLFVVGSLGYRPEAIAQIVDPTTAATAPDLLAAVALIAAVLEAGRRVAGWPALVGILLWGGSLAFRDRLPGPLRDEAFDLAPLVVGLYAGGDGGLLTTPLALVVEWFAPILILAGIARSARLAPLVANLLRPFGVAPAASAVSAPFLIAPDGRAGAGSLATLRALLPLTPPALGFGALLAGQALGDIGGLAWRLLPPSVLALAVTIARRRTDRWHWVWPLPPIVLPSVTRLSAGQALVVGGPLAGLLLLPAPASFLVGAVLAATGALLARPTMETSRELVGGLVWAAKQAPLGGALILLFGLVETLDGASGLSNAVREALVGVSPIFAPVGLAVLALVLGLLFLPAAAAGVLILTAGPTLPDPAGGVVAGLFWIAAASVVAGRLRARALFGRIVWAMPLALVALVATRAAFEERGPLSFPLLAIESVAVVAVGTALASRAPLGGPVRVGVLLLGVFLLSPRADLGVLLVLGAVAVVLVATLTGSPRALDVRRWKAPPAAVGLAFRRPPPVALPAQTSGVPLAPKSESGQAGDVSKGAGPPG
ncbi:MAG: hypothetical protein U0556_12470 [Dehalococcoidia bacterium]